MIKSRRIEIVMTCLFACLLFIVHSCERPGDEIDIPTGPTPTVDYLVEQGWVSYESGDYSDAKSQFNTAINRDVFYTEAYLGLGWSLNRLSDYSNAIPKFDLLLTLVEDTNTEFKLMSYAGKALSYMGLNSDSLSFLQSEQFLDIASSDFVSEHDSRISTDNMKKMLLNGYWNYQSYYKVQNAIIEHFESNWFNDLINSDDNLVEIVDVDAQITVEIEVDTSQTPYDTTITSAKIEFADDYNLLELTEITDSASVSTSYPHKSFVYGGNQIYINTDEMDDVEMLLDDLTQAVKVDFVNAKDYGVYLNVLMTKMQSLFDD